MWRRCGDIFEKYKVEIEKLSFLLIFYVVGIFTYHRLESWRYLDCFYFITVTSYSVGFGDISPATYGGRIFSIFYAPIGLSVTFNIFSSYGVKFLAAMEEQSFNIFKKNNESTALIRLVILFFIVGVVMMLGSICLGHLEPTWSFLDGVYFAIVIGSTVGYGDLVPTSDASKLFVSFYIIVLVVFLLMMVGNLAAINHSINQEKKRKTILERSLDLELLNDLAMDTKGLTKTQFVFGVLEQLDYISMADDVQRWIRRFHELDVDGSHFLTKEDILLKPGALSLYYAPAAVVNKAFFLTKQASQAITRAPSQVFKMLRTSFIGIEGSIHPGQTESHDDEMSSKSDRLEAIQHAKFAKSGASESKGSSENFKSAFSSNGQNVSPTKKLRIVNPLDTLAEIDKHEDHENYEENQMSPVSMSKRFDSPSARNRPLAGLPTAILVNTPTDQLITHFTVPPRRAVTADHESLFDYLRRRGVFSDRDLERYANMGIMLSIMLSFYIFGCLFYVHYEGWSIVNSIFFISATVTTVGFGDFAPTNDASRIFTMFFIVLNLIFLLTSLVNIANDLMTKWEEQLRSYLNLSGTYGKNKSNHRLRWLISISCFFATMMIGTVVFKETERIKDDSCGHEGQPLCRNWYWSESFYFCLICTLTIGYGDLRVTSIPGKWFCIIYILVAVVFNTAVISNVVSMETEVLIEHRIREKMAKELSVDILMEFDNNHDGKVDEYEFVSGILDQLGLINRIKDCDPWAQRFHELDKDNSGFLDVMDLATLAESIGTFERVTSANRLPSNHSEPGSVSPASISQGRGGVTIAPLSLPLNAENSPAAYSGRSGRVRMTLTARALMGHDEIPEPGSSRMSNFFSGLSTKTARSAVSSLSARSSPSARSGRASDRLSSRSGASIEIESFKRISATSPTGEALYLDRESAAKGITDGVPGIGL